jgi:3-isopropylmalate dehydrogenase
MARYRIAWMPGDGIGNDVMEAAKVVLDAMAFDAEYVHADIGWEFWCREGDALPERTIDLLGGVDAALFGAITSKPKEEAQDDLAPELKGKGLVYSSPIVRLRQHFDLATNLRPCKAYPGNPLNYRDDIDLVVFRQNTEDLYAGIEYHPVPEELASVLGEHPKWARFADVPLEDVALTLRVNTREACREIIRAGFEYAKKHGYPTVTVVEKPNVLRETSGLMVRTAREVAADYPGIELWETNIDAMAMWLVKNPDQYGVLVASNLFGDIISDLCAQLVGGLGFASSANIGEKLAVFEPTHGSAPKYAGKYVTNPTAMLLTARLMLDWLGEHDEAARLETAVARTIAGGKARTYDMGGSSSTLEMAAEVARNLA